MCRHIDGTYKTFLAGNTTTISGYDDESITSKLDFTPWIRHVAHSGSCGNRCKQPGCELEPSSPRHAIPKTGLPTLRRKYKIDSSALRGFRGREQWKLIEYADMQSVNVFVLRLLVYDLPGVFISPFYGHILKKAEKYGYRLCYSEFWWISYDYLMWRSEDHILQVATAFDMIENYLSENTQQ